MAEPVEPKRPKASTPGYLPRLWKAAPEPEVPEEPAPAKSAKKKRAGAAGDGTEAKAKKKKKAKPSLDDGTGATKLEETPALDTYQARQRARWIIGGILGGVGLVALILTVRAFRGGSEEEGPQEAPEPRVVDEKRANPELEARNIVDNARQADKAGKVKAATDLLEKAARNYQPTVAGREAMHALDRHQRNLSLFGTDGPEQALGPKPPPPGNLVASNVPRGGAPGSVPGPTAPAPAGNAEGPNPSAATAPIAQAPPPIPIKPLPPGFREQPGTSIHPSGWPAQIRSERDGGVMVLVPGGTFLMGREDGETTERPTHRVALSTYYIDQHEVTVRQFVQFLKETGRPIDAAKLIPKEATDPAAVDDLPAVNVSSQQAKAYCDWARKKLPTEAQWEFAARSGDGRVSYWNGELPRKDPEKAPRTMEAVMSLSTDVSPFGAFDMGANAWEWTAEFWDSQYYQQFRNTAVDPAGPRQSRSKPAQMTVKGGSKAGVLTWRDGQKIETRLPFLGFRGALPVEVPPAATAGPTIAPSTNPNAKLPGGVVPF